MITIGEFEELLNKHINPLGYNLGVERSPNRNYVSKSVLYFESLKDKSDYVGRLLLNIYSCKIHVVDCNFRPKIYQIHWGASSYKECEEMFNTFFDYKYKILPSYYLTCKDIIE